MNARPLLDSALDLAAGGVPVFPVKKNKRPCQDGGFKTASTDPAAIRRMFADPLATLIGFPTGAASGIDVLDIDPEKAGDTWYRENDHRLPATRTHHTRRPGGFHKLFKHSPGLRLSTDNPARGVDIRADSGYAIHWPQQGYHVSSDALADWPDWLLLEITRNQVREKSTPADAADLAPPDAASLMFLLASMPNPESAGRDDYVAVNLAVQGCIRGLEMLEREVDQEQIQDAAAAWSARWNSADASDFERERARWDDDWSQRDRDISGWRHLLGMASKLGMDVSAYALASAASEFPPLPDEPEPLASAPQRDRPKLYRFRRGQNPYGDRRWLVHEMLPETGVAFLAGQYAAGKTFVALDIAHAVMTGAHFAGSDVDRRGGVLFLAAEGEAELPVRLEAILQAKGGPDDLPFIWQDDVPVLLESGAAEKLASAAKIAALQFAAEGLPLCLVIVDTVAAAAGWSDENNAAEAQRVIRVLQTLAKASGALVLAIDHHGKDAAAGVRGSTAKSAGAEAVLSVLGDKVDSGVTTNRRLALHKVRGGVSGREIAFNLSDMVIGTDAKGRDMTSCVVEWQPDRRQEATVAKLSRGSAAALMILHEMIAADDGASVVESDWRDACTESRRVSAAEERKSRSTAVRRAFSDLIDRGLVTFNGGLVSLAAKCPEFAAASHDGDKSDKSDIVANVSHLHGDICDNTTRGVSLVARDVAVRSEIQGLVS